MAREQLYSRLSKPRYNSLDRKGNSIPGYTYLRTQVSGKVLTSCPRYMSIMPPCIPGSGSGDPAELSCQPCPRPLLFVPTYSGLRKYVGLVISELLIGCLDRSSLAGVPIAIFDGVKSNLNNKNKKEPKRAERFACKISSPEGMPYTPFRTLPMSSTCAPADCNVNRTVRC